MKAFDELTEAELCDLTVDQVATYIDYQCAEDGVPLLPFLPPEPKVEWPEPDSCVYYLKLGYREIDDLPCLSVDDAARLMEALAKVQIGQVDYISTPSLRTSYALRAEPTRQQVEIVSKPVYSAALYAAAKDALAAAERDKKVYSEARTKYDKAKDARQQIVTWIHERIEEAASRRARRADAQQTFDRYVALADGNRRIAWNFLLRADADARTLLPDLVAEFDADVIERELPDAVPEGQ